MRIDKSWLEWIAHNAAEGVQSKDLMTVMLQHGVEKDDARILIEWVTSNPLMGAVQTLHKKHEKMASMMRNLNAVQKQASDIQKIDTPDEDTFYQKYWRGNQPVVLKGMVDDWQAMTKWTMPFLSENFGDHVIEIQENREKDPNYEINSINHKTKVTVRDFIDRIGKGPSNDFYMTANNHIFETEEMGVLLNDIGSVPSYITPPKERDGNWFLWVGPAGTITPLHHDENIIFHTQIKGRKRWKLISPMDTPNLYNHKAVFSEVDLFNIDYDRFPLMRGVQVADFVVEPGETLFLPLGWWHGVEALEPSISVSSVAFKYPNHWKFSNP